MVDAENRKLSVSNQCRLLNLNRSTYYYKKKPVKPQDLKLMRLIDEQYLKTPSWGSRSMRNHLRRLGYKINRKRVQGLMRLMGLEAIYPKPKTSRPHPAHKVYPYLLRNTVVEHPNQVWAADISVLQQRRALLFEAQHEKLHKRWRNRPSEVCLQGPASNHLQRHRSKAIVVSVEGKGATNASGMNREGEHP